MDNDQLISILLRHLPELQAAYLFGSHGTEWERPDSDIDIAVLLPVSADREQTAAAFRECIYELMDHIDKKVDLIDLRRVDTVFRNEIISSGRLIHESGTNAKDIFEMLTLSLYQKLNEERKPILDEIVRSGKVLA